MKEKAIGLQIISGCVYLANDYQIHIKNRNIKEQKSNKLEIIH